MDKITEADVVHALPPESANSFLRAYVVYAAGCTDAHASYHLLAGLSIISQTCPIDYSFPFGLPMHSNIYGLSVGRSSDARKSAAISVARDILDHTLPGAVGEVPGSKENLVDALKRNPRQLIMYPEFGSFLSQAERGYMNPLKTTFTEAWDGTPLGRGLVKRQDTEARTPRLSMLAASTLEYLERHTELADWTGGFMARFICMYADRERLYTVPVGARVGRDEIVRRVQHMAEGANLGSNRGRCLGFSSESHHHWNDWYRRVITSARTTEETAGIVARTHAHALRIALLLAWDFGHARGEWGDFYITPRELEIATRIAGLHLRSVTRIGSNLSGSRDMREKRAVLNAIPDSGSITLGEVITRSRLLKRRTQELLETLLEEGLITHQFGADGKRGQCFIRTEAAARAFTFSTAAETPPEEEAPAAATVEAPHWPSEGQRVAISAVTSTPESMALMMSSSQVTVLPSANTLPPDASISALRFANSSGLNEAGGADLSVANAASSAARMAYQDETGSLIFDSE